MGVSHRNLALHLVKVLTAISLGGVLLGSLKARPVILLLALLVIAAGLSCVTLREVGATRPNALRLLSRLVIVAVVGLSWEYWGTSNGHWLYHELQDGTTMPVWLPAAWMNAYLCISWSMRRLARHLNLEPTRRYALVLAAACYVYPSLGEGISIQLGVWTYYWPYKVFNVPVLAGCLLCLTHSSFELAFRRHLKWNQTSPRS